jgi:hypothetical protein
VSLYRSDRHHTDPSTTVFNLRAARERRGSLALRLLGAAVVVFVLVNVLLVEAYANARFAPDGTHRAERTGTVPAAVRDGGPVIDASADQPRSRGMPQRTVALTFDDGPDPRWTPLILDTLRRHHARATFFVVGSQVARHPDLARRIVAEGHEIGAHTFSHPQLADMPRWRRDLEHAQTQAAIAAATGVTGCCDRRTRRFRTPSTTPAGPPCGRRPAAATSPCSTTSTAATGSGPASTRSSATPRPRTAPERSCSCTTRVATGRRRSPRWTA